MQVSFLDAPISPNGLFGPAVEGFAERFTEAQKASQAMRHFLPKCSSSAAAHSRPKTCADLAAREACTCCPRPSACQDSADMRALPLCRRHPVPKCQGPRPRIVLDPAPPASSWSAGQEEERAKSRQAQPPTKQPLLKNLFSPVHFHGRGNVFVANTGPVQRPKQPSAVIVEKIKHKHSQKRADSSSVPHEVPCLRAVGHSSLSNPLPRGPRPGRPSPECQMGYGDNKTRLFTPIHSKTPAFQRRGLHLGAGRERSRSTLRGDDVVGKRSHRKGSSSSERVRLLQPLLPRPQKGWRPPAHPRSLRSEVMTLVGKRSHRKGSSSSERVRLLQPLLSSSPKKDGGLRPILDLRRLNHALMRRSFRMITLKQILSQIRTGDWFCSLDLKDAYFHIQIQTILEIRLRGSGFSVHGVLPFGCLWPPALLRSAWTRLFPL